MPDESITQLNYIQQAAKDREQENLQFREYVKVDLDLSDYRLNAVVKQATQEVWAHIECRTCANCCKTRHPLFSRVEVERIAEYLGLTVQELRTHYLEYDGETGRYMTRELPCAIRDRGVMASTQHRRSQAFTERSRDDSSWKPLD